MLVINIQKAGLFSEIRKVIQKVLRVLKLSFRLEILPYTLSVSENSQMYWFINNGGKSFDLHFLHKDFKLY